MNKYTDYEIDARPVSREAMLKKHGDMNNEFTPTEEERDKANETMDKIAYVAFMAVVISVVLFIAKDVFSN